MWTWLGNRRKRDRLLGYVEGVEDSAALWGYLHELGTHPDPTVGHDDSEDIRFKALIHIKGTRILVEIKGAFFILPIGTQALRTVRPLWEGKGLRICRDPSDGDCTCAKFANIA